MKIRTWLAAVMLTSFVGRAAAQSSQDAPSKEEDRRRGMSDMMRRLLPDGADADEAQRKVDVFLGLSGVKNRTTVYRTGSAVEAATEAYVPVEISGEATYAAIDALIDGLFRLPRMVTIGSLNLSGVSDERVCFAAVFRFHFWPAAAETPEAGRLSARVAMVARLKELQRNPLRVLAAFDGTPVAVTGFSFDGAFQVRGSRALPGPSLREALTRAGARLTALESTPDRSGACESFEARGVLVKSDAESWTTDRTWLFAPADRKMCEPQGSVGARRVPDAARLQTADGTTFSFELVRSAGGDRPELLVSTGVMNGTSTAYRILADRRRRYFGYALTAEPLEERRFRVHVGPLDADTRARLSKEYGDLMGDPVAIQYPEPQIVGSGEALLLELMVNPKTNEKLSDVIRVGAPPRGTMALQIVNGVLSRNGTFQTRTGTARGLRINFVMGDVGLISLGLEPQDRGKCVPAALTQDPKAMWAGAITFEWDKDKYVWTSRDPIVLDRPAPNRLWVCVDTRQRPVGSDAGGFL